MEGEVEGDEEEGGGMVNVLLTGSFSNCSTSLLFWTHLSNS